MDVKTLYSSFQHSDGIKACEISMIENGFTSMEISNITKINFMIYIIIKLFIFFYSKDEVLIQNCMIYVKQRTAFEVCLDF